MSELNLPELIEEIIKWPQWPTSGTLVVAVSGGPDSVCMLRLLHEIASRKGFALHVAHLDHCLRGEASEGDAKFVEELAKKLNWSSTIKKVDVKAVYQQCSGSLQQVCRDIRQDFLANVTINSHAFGLAYGHNKSDQAETILQHLIRGSGLAGLTGMSSFEITTQGWVNIRPLLHISRAQILQLLAYWQLDYRIDASNDSDKYQRNHIRHHLIPFIETNYNTQIIDRLADMAKILSLENDYLQLETEKVKRKHVKLQQDAVVINCDGLGKYHRTIVMRTMRDAYAMLHSSTDNLSYAHSLALVNLVFSHHGDAISLPNGIKCERIYNQIFVYYLDKWGKYSEKAAPIGIFDEVKISLKNSKALTVEQVELNDCQIANSNADHEVYFDAEAIAWPLFLRTRLNGDRFFPFGAPGTKKLKDYFIDQKTPRHLRDQQLLLVDNTGCILWIVGVRRSGHALITDNTKRIIKCSLMEEKQHE